jgi:hypothetical protein
MYAPPPSATPRLPIVRQLLVRVIKPTLARLADGDPGIDGDAAAMLLLGTAAAESEFRALAQHPTGPALGFWQVEPGTHHDVKVNFLRFRPALRTAVDRLLAPDPAPEQQLVSNLAYACAIARVVYRRSPLRLAAPDDIAGHAAVWKAAYNTMSGKGTEAHFVSAWQRLVAPSL